jgi:hypothetical protein
MPKHVQPVPYQAKFINNLAQIFCSSSPLLGHSSRTEGDSWRSRSDPAPHRTGVRAAAPIYESFRSCFLVAINLAVARRRQIPYARRSCQIKRYFVLESRFQAEFTTIFCTGLRAIGY